VRVFIHASLLCAHTHGRSATNGPRSSFGGVVHEAPGAAGGDGGGRGLVAAASVTLVCAAAGVVGLMYACGCVCLCVPGA